MAADVWAGVDPAGAVRMEAGMEDQAPAREFSLILGMVSGLFSVTQVLVSVSAARANQATIASLQHTLARFASGGGNPLLFAGQLVPVLVATYGAMIVTGAICLGFCWYAGRLTAYVNGTPARGAVVGLRVAFLSGVIWILFSVTATLVTHADGTLTGLLTSLDVDASLAAQLIGLVAQEVMAVLVGLALGAWAGYVGAHSLRYREKSSPGVTR